MLIAAQNEEATIASCIRSFLSFGDELIVVDNGSTDQTKAIVRDLAARHPEKIRFYDVPDLPDLHQNRQFAFERSNYEWILRADADYIAYTDGEYDIGHFRDFLLSRRRTPWPEGVYVPQCNVVGDFRHTGLPLQPGGLEANPERRYIPGPASKPMLRFYRHFRFLRFQRRGRWEGVRCQLFLRPVRWPRPLWMHCTIKSSMNHLFRSERTNWRQLGDFRRFPTLHDYLASVVEKKYGTDDLDEAANIYMNRNVLPFLQPYDPEQHHPYPSLVLEQLQRNPVYRIEDENGCRIRRRLGADRPADRRLEPLVLN